MSKKSVLAIAGSVVLLIILIVLFVLEMQYPEGGAVLLGQLS